MVNEKRRDVLVLFTNGTAMIRTVPTDKHAWNVAREFAIRGIEDRERGFIIPLSMIQEIQVREHDPDRLTPKPVDEPRIILPHSAEAESAHGVAIS